MSLETSLHVSLLILWKSVQKVHESYMHKLIVLGSLHGVTWSDAAIPLCSGLLNHDTGMPQLSMPGYLIATKALLFCACLALS